MQIRRIPAQRMAVVRTVGDPNVVGPRAIPALYGSVFTLKFARKKEGADFKVRALRARWPDVRMGAHDAGGAAGTSGTGAGAKQGWRGEWGLPVPAGTRALPQKVPGVEVRPETWQYGTVAEALHIGPYATEPETVGRLLEFVAAQGYEIAGAHEEEYLTRPTAKVMKTLIRYPVRKKRSG